MINPPNNTTRKYTNNNNNNNNRQAVKPEKKYRKKILQKLTTLQKLTEQEEKYTEKLEKIKKEKEKTIIKTYNEGLLKPDTEKLVEKEMKYKPRKCTRCNKKFIPTTPNKKYCSKECTEKTKKEQNREAVRRYREKHYK